MYWPFCAADKLVTGVCCACFLEVWFASDGFLENAFLSCEGPDCSVSKVQEECDLELILTHQSLTELGPRKIST